MLRCRLRTTALAVVVLSPVLLTTGAARNAPPLPALQTITEVPPDAPQVEPAVAVVTPERDTMNLPLQLTPYADSEWSAGPVIETEAVMIGLRWSDAAPGAMEMRTRNTSGTWSVWEPLEPTDLSEDGAPQPQSSEPVWIGREVSAVQYRVFGAGDVEALLVHDGFEQATAEPGPDQAVQSTATTDNGVVVNLRDTWDVSDCRDPDAIVGYSNVRMAVVHHTAGSNSYSAGDVPSIIHAICQYHVDGNGWDDIAYNFLVDKFGNVWEGREGGIHLPVRGAHSQGFNSFSAGFALMGDHGSTQPTSDALQSLGEMIGWKMWLEQRPVLGTTKIESLGSVKWPAGTVVTLNRVSGHRDVQSTSCPGDAAYDDLATVRSIASSEKQALPKTKGGVSGDFGGDGDLDGATLTGDGRWMVSGGQPSSFAAPVKWFDFAKPANLKHHLVGDFNGDGKDDVASLRTINGRWRVGISTGSGFTMSTWLQLTAPAAFGPHLVGDFNGDGKDDIASYRADEGRWRIAISTGNAFNLSTWYDYDSPGGLLHHRVGDFNGDGKDDIASFRTGQGKWRVGISTGSSLVVSTWYQYDVPKGLRRHVVGDFNGDGQDDIATQRVTNGTWKVAISSGSGFTATTWANVDMDEGWSHALTADFAGDSSDDIAHFAARHGAWFMLKATADGDFVVTEWAHAPRTLAPGAAGHITGSDQADMALMRPTGDWVGHIAVTGAFEIWLP